MKHKILLALFLCLVIIFSHKIVSLENDVVQVKDVSYKAENYSIDTIKEEKEDLKIDIYYPVTKYENVNVEIMKRIQEYIVKVKEAEYVSNPKYLKISFEDFKWDNYNSFKFNVEYNEGLVHDNIDIFTIVYNNEKIITLEDINSVNIDALKEKAKEKLKSEINVESELNSQIIDQNDTYSNFVINNNKIVVFLNKSLFSGLKSNIDTIEVEYIIN